MLIYDCEIIKAIPKTGEPRLDGIEYCEGWRDFKGMGISVIGAYDYQDDRYRVFCADNFDAFQSLVDSRGPIIGFNSLAFDNRLCDASGINVPDHKSYDLLVEIWGAAGLALEFQYPSHAGYGLGVMASANLNGERKSGHGALAPLQWQRGEIGYVIDYCLQDARLTKMLVDRIMDSGKLVSPVTGETLKIEPPIPCNT